MKNYDLMNKRELAHSLRVSERSIDNWMSAGVIPYLKVGKKTIRFQWDKVINALENRNDEMNDRD